jgi:hypothetical protein
MVIIEGALQSCKCFAQSKWNGLVKYCIGRR